MKAFACTLLTALLAASGVARAEQQPFASRYDPRMRYVTYNAGEVVHLSTAVGATLVVGFGRSEAVNSVAVSDSKDLAASPRGNYLFFKSKVALATQPVIVLTTSGAGLRRYVFDITTRPDADLGATAADVYYSVQFLYPNEEAAARRAVEAAEAAKVQAQEQAREAELELHYTHQALEQHARDPFAGPRNWRYVAQGNRSFFPFEVFDNGDSTVFRFPGSVRIPSIFAINPDGQEATPNYSVKGDLVQVDQVARGWRLRDGKTVLCIWNLGFDPVGHHPPTETTSPNVQRVIGEAPP
jgi:type IV secretion system protein VirB9